MQLRIIDIVKKQSNVVKIINIKKKKKKDVEKRIDVARKMSDVTKKTNVARDKNNHATRTNVKKRYDVRRTDIMKRSNDARRIGVGSMGMKTTTSVKISGVSPFSQLRYTTY